MLIKAIQSKKNFLMRFKVIGVECQTVSLKPAIDFPWLIVRLEVIVIQIWMQDESTSTIFYIYQMILHKKSDSMRISMTTQYLETQDTNPPFTR
ncbi:hypothetical protein GcM3_096026 [Golovinomyces cichoracearum]|uniref:Uncharacterized protein n=1 Tax=Golovinomyces cichoracearum TaxID=62708 RepID=A0A420IEF0_9PEZI|nr:hypothetical protein GcM3_096026 [Golovinomyces cichoracearum]